MGRSRKHKITKLFSFSGLKRTDIEETQIGDIVAIAGIPGITIGESFCDLEDPKPLAADYDRRADDRDPVQREQLGLSPAAKASSSRRAICAIVSTRSC